MKVLFVDHAFHRKTRSSEFFQQILALMFDVEVFYVDPESDQHPLASLPDGLDLVVIWQMDFLAPIFIAMGCRVVVIPMFDGSSILPDIHWFWSRQARFVNFSRRLHAKIRRTGTESLLVKYFIKPDPRHRKRSFAKLNVMLWQRRPEHGINLRLIERVLGDQISRLHIHDSVDDKKIDSSAFLKPGLDHYRLTTSTWFKDQADYRELLDRHNVYFAPRLSEGIGMGFIEAMASGMLVFAADAPTHDEYISNWINGILVHPQSSSLAHVAHDAERIAQMAWRTCELGHEQWQAGIPDILEFIRTTPRPELRDGIAIEALGDALIASYQAGIPSYTSFLMNNRRAMNAVVPDSAQLGYQVESSGSISRTTARPAPPGLRDAFSAEQQQTLPWLDQNRLDFSRAGESRFVSSGSVQIDAGCAWVIGDGISIDFTIDPGLGATSELVIDYRKADASAVRYLLILNGRTLSEGTLGDQRGTIHHPVSPGFLQHLNSLRIQAIDCPSGQSPVARVRSAWGLTRIEFI